MHLIYRKLLPLLAIAAFLGTSIQAWPAEPPSAREKTIYQLPYIQSTVEIDGIISETVWKKSLVIELNYETSPRENTTPPVKTIVYLYEDGETLYVAFDARDDNPEQIRDFLLDRDNIWNSDFVGIKFDTFGKSRKIFQFFTKKQLPPDC